MSRTVRLRHLSWIVPLLVVIVVLGTTAIGLAAEGPAPLRTDRLLGTSVVFPGPVPKLVWPAQGQAAVSVTGLGSLGVSGPQTPQPTASVAKIMTAYVVLHDHPLTAGDTGFVVTISAADVADEMTRAAQGQSVVAVAAGEQLNEEQLLEGLLLPSGNNLAAILADVDAGSIPAFVAKMNTTAQALGMTATTYTDPSGFVSTTVSTAADQVRLATAAMAVPAFAYVVALPSATLPVVGTVKNFNALVGTAGYVGIKTGSDSQAGGCLVFAAKRIIGGRTVQIIGAVLGQDVGRTATTTLIDAAISGTTALVDSVTANVAVRVVVPAATPVASVTNPDGRHVTVITRHPLSRLGYGGLTVPLTVSITPLVHRLTVGQYVATISLGGDTTASESTTATATATMPGISLRWKLHHML